MSYPFSPLNAVKAALSDMTVVELVRLSAELRAIADQIDDTKPGSSGPTVIDFPPRPHGFTLTNPKTADGSVIVAALVPVSQRVEIAYFQDSAVLEKGKYDFDTLELEITFRHGNTYLYENVSPETWDGLQAADSAGIYYASHIKMK